MIEKRIIKIRFILEVAAVYLLFGSTKIHRILINVRFHENYPTAGNNTKKPLVSFMIPSIYQNIGFVVKYTIIRIV
jgi:hypothetical protein